MWNLTSYDVNRIKGQLQARRARIDAKYAEETKALDADFADVETLERVAGVLADKYKSDEPANPEQENSETAHDGNARIEDGAPSEPQLRAASQHRKWELHLPVSGLSCLAHRTPASRNPTLSKSVKQPDRVPEPAE